MYIYIYIYIYILYETFISFAFCHMIHNYTSGYIKNDTGFPLLLFISFKLAKFENLPQMFFYWKLISDLGF